MNANLESLFTVRPPRPLPFAAGTCATPGCPNAVTEPWEETGTLCATCAVAEELNDREGRRERAFPPDVDGRPAA